MMTPNYHSLQTRFFFLQAKRFLSEYCVASSLISYLDSYNVFPPNPCRWLVDALKCSWMCICRQLFNPIIFCEVNIHKLDNMGYRTTLQCPSYGYLPHVVIP